MWTPLALAAAVGLAPAQPPATGGLQLGNVRYTQGELGPTRKDGRVIPGDILYVRYDIDGLTIDPDGATRYQIGLEVSDAAGKLAFRQDPAEQATLVLLRGGRMPAGAFITVGLDQPPGVYTCKLTAVDLKGPGAKPEEKPRATASVKFEVARPEFGLVQAYTSHDPNGVLVAPTTGVVGQTLNVNHTAVVFARDPRTKQPDVLVEYQILDEKGQPILAKPVVKVQDAKAERVLDEKDVAFKLSLPIFLSRPGKFTVRATATDRVANKKATSEMPLTVLPAN
ncbi:MAG: hypothetical protein K2X82_25810 [Gemmataceae bacterium]|nr:hypothetical protein [Gemmataceae bacterium]